MTHRFSFLVMVTAVAVLLCSASAATAHQQQFYRIQYRQTVPQIADSLGVSVETLRQWNPGLGQVPYAGQTLYAQDPGPNPARIWAFHLGAPACIPFDVQIDEIERQGDVPADVCQQMRVAIEATGPIRKTWVKRGSRHAGAVFCDKHGNPVVQGETVCMWVDPKTRQPIDSLETAEFAPIEHGDIVYIFRQYEGCRNAAWDTLHIVRQPPPAPPVVTAPPEGFTPPPVTYQPPPPVSAPPSVHPSAANHGVLWATYERVQPENDDQEPQDNLFTGIENVWYLNPAQTFGLGGRGSWNLLMGDFTTNYRLMAELTPVRSLTRAYGLKLRPFYWYDASQRSWYDTTEISPTRSVWKRHRDWFDGHGPGGQAIIYFPPLTYLDLDYRTGTSLVFDRRVTASTEPGWLYLKFSASEVRTKEQSRQIDGRRISFVPVRMTMAETRIGIKPVPTVIVSVSWDVWSFRSEIWDFLKKGPGTGIEWRPKGGYRWRWIGTYKYLTTDSHDPVAESRGHSPNRFENDREHRATIGFTYGW